MEARFRSIFRFRQVLSSRSLLRGLLLRSPGSVLPVTCCSRRKQRSTVPSLALLHLILISISPPKGLVTVHLPMVKAPLSSCQPVHRVAPMVVLPVFFPAKPALEWVRLRQVVILQYGSTLPELASTNQLRLVAEPLQSALVKMRVLLVIFSRFRFLIYL